MSTNTLDYQNDQSSSSVVNREDLVTPWEVAATGEAGVDYNKLLVRFGCQKLNDLQLKRLESLCNKPAHHYLRRDIFFAHRDFDLILDRYEKGQPFYLYTGRGPSSQAMHLGHLIPFIATKYFQ